MGPFKVRGPSGAVTLAGGKQRLLLAMLVLHAGELVSRTAIIDALWPEDPPASAAQSVESYVSRLRAALRAAGAAEGIIASSPGGYQLTRAGNRFDCDEFAELAAQAHTALDRGDAQAASDLADEALALWHGPGLAGIAEEPGVRASAAALEEGRVQVLETRAEAKLALGRHTELISELRAGVSSHPERERAHELLMIALYRAGRQTEALDVYRAAHAHLDGELGLEPGAGLRELQSRILRHDPSLVAPRPATPADRETTAAIARGGLRPRGMRVGLAAVLAAALGIAAVVLIVTSPGNAAAAKTLRSPALGVFSTQSGQPRSAAVLGAVPSRITAGLGAQWATSYDNGTLLRVSPSASAVTQTVYVGHGATGVAVAAGDVWVADTLDNRLTRVDGRTDEVVQQIPVGANPGNIAAGAGAVWVTNRGDGTVSRVDPLTGAVLGVTRVGPAPSGIAVGAGAVWVALSGASAVVRLDTRSGQLLQTIQVGSGPSAIVVGRDGVWVANQLDSTVSLINPDSASVTLTRAVAGTPTALAAVGRGVWITADAPLLTMMRASGQTRTLAIPSPATALASGPMGLLVGVSGIGTNHRGGTLVMRVTGPIDQINPEQCCSLPPNVRILSYDSLLAYSRSPASPDTLVPDLALAIPAEQDAGLSYTFRVRPGVRYWTGVPVRASDFRRGLERAAQDSSILAAYIGALPGALACPNRPRCDLQAAVLTNDRTGTITLRLSRPDPELLPALGLPYFAPVPPGGGINPGTGPYRVARFAPGQLIDLKRNRYFHEWAPAAQPAGYPDRILVYSAGTASADIAAVLSGRADYTFDTPAPSQLRQIQLRSPGLLHTVPLPDTDFLDLNTHTPPFNDLRVRQALNFAVDRGAIARLYGGLDAATPTCQIIPATIPGHAAYCPYTSRPSPSGTWTGANLPRARQLITASGTRGEAVTVLTQAPSGPWDEPVARYIIGLLRQLGYRAPRTGAHAQPTQCRNRRLPQSPPNRDRLLGRGLPLTVPVDHPAAQLRRVAPANPTDQPRPVLRPHRRPLGRPGQPTAAHQPDRRQSPLGARGPPDHQPRAMDHDRHHNGDRPRLSPRG